MIAKNLLFVGFASCWLVAAGCGDDGDAPCEGHGCPGAGVLELPEGADIRIETYDTGPNGASERLVAMQAMFFKEQTPPARSLEGIPIAGCTDMRSGILFDNGYSDGAQAIADSRTYFDVGDTFTFTNVGSSAAFVIPKATAIPDPSSYLTHPIGYTTDTWEDGLGGSTPPAAADVEMGQWYSMSFPGSAELSEFAPSRGETPAGVLIDGADLKGIYLPQVTTMISPAEADYYVHELPATGDMTYEWTVPTEAANAPNLFAFVSIFNNDTGAIDFTCIEPQNDGNLVVPEEVIALAPASGSLLWGTFTHVGWEQEGRAHHTLGVQCKYGSYSKATE